LGASPAEDLQKFFGAFFQKRTSFFLILIALFQTQDFIAFFCLNVVALQRIAGQSRDVLGDP
jgi:hypothetical protein